MISLKFSIYFQKKFHFNILKIFRFYLKKFIDSKILTIKRKMLNVEKKNLMFNHDEI